MERLLAILCLLLIGFFVGFGMATYAHYREKRKG